MNRVAEIILNNKGIRFKKEFEENHLLAGMVVRVIHKGENLTLNHKFNAERSDLDHWEQSNEKVAVPNVIGFPLTQAENTLRRQD